MERLTVATRTEVLVGRGLPEPILPPRADRSRVALLTQPTPTQIALEIATRLESEGVKCEVIGLPDRDETKTLDVAESVYGALTKFALARNDTIVGVGGGSVTDLSGFVAGTWLRGVESINVATTLLGAVDAAIGGKTGVNFGGKNLVGVIWHPARVIVDLEVLDALPLALKRDGLVEAIKAGFISDPTLADLIEDQGLGADLDQVVVRAVRVKSEIVGEDDREHGVRALLNFGHTVGHAIEFASTLSHGEAVGLGMIAESAVSEKKLGFRGIERVRNAMTKLDAPTTLEGIDVTRVIELLRHDKKRDARGMRMVLLREFGEPELSAVDESDIEVALAGIGL